MAIVSTTLFGTCTNLAPTQPPATVAYNSCRGGETGDWQCGKSSPKVQVWPNPIRDWLELQVPGLPAGVYRFVLRDALGRVVAATDVLGGRAILYVRELAAGAYWWSLDGKTGVLVPGKALG